MLIFACENIIMHNNTARQTECLKNINNNIDSMNYIVRAEGICTVATLVWPHFYGQWKSEKFVYNSLT